jgi:hypothetical protein
MDDHARCVDDSAQTRCPGCSELFPEAFAQVAGVRAGAYLFTRAGEYVTGDVDRQRIVAAACELVD